MCKTGACASALAASATCRQRCNALHCAILPLVISASVVGTIGAVVVDWGITPVTAATPCQTKPGVSFARYIPSRRLAHLAVVDCFHRGPGPDHRTPAVFAAQQDTAAQTVR